MPCERIGNAIVCSPRRRKFTWKRRVYFVEEGGWGRSIWDSAKDEEVIFWEFTGRKLSKFVREINKRIKGWH